MLGSYLLSCSLRSWVPSLAPIARQLSSLVVVEHDKGRLLPSTLNAVTAASQIGEDITALVTGSEVQEVSRSASCIGGVKKVLVADHPLLAHDLAEPQAKSVANVQRRLSFSHILAPSSTFGRNLLPRAAALLGVQPVSDILQVMDPDTYLRPMYAGNVVATVRYKGPGLRMLTVRTTSFPQAPLHDSPQAEVVPVGQEEMDGVEEAAGLSQWESEEVTKTERPDLGSAKVVICGGRALKSAENFAMLERLADLLGGAVGASRAAVDAGYVANDLQVGQTGKVVAPELYIAVGISGAIQHLAGMKDSKTIVAINTDPEAPIFQVADYGLVQDLFTVLPELESEIKKLKGT